MPTPDRERPPAAATAALTRWAVAELTAASADTVVSLNARLASRVTVGGRAGSGFGSILEVEWGDEVARRLRDSAAELDAPAALELAWMTENGYNDFALIDDTLGAAGYWTPENRVGEVLRVEVKSMALGATEPKAHFDALASEIGPHDLLVVLMWRWDDVPNRPGRVRPLVVDTWVGSALAIAELRDALHVARGGTFVTADTCLDRCGRSCPHVGEPLNSKGTRERLSGPRASVTGDATHAANFGGLVRMLKVRSASIGVLAAACANDTARDFVDFIHTYLPDEELHAFPRPLWSEAARLLDCPADTPVEDIRRIGAYRDALFCAAHLLSDRDRSRTASPTVSGRG
jgi:hypothetical protein